ncbi:MAG: electron transport complex subunit E, partial [Clostridiales bacterium]|nr:electron transport complex subunit E [Clostridiales bacterium]
YDSLGIYIPLIVVNCIILGRAESYASKNGPIPSVFDGIGMGLGFTLGLTCIGIVREILGAGQIFGVQVLPLADSAACTAGYTPVTIFVLAPGAFFVLAFLIAVQNAYKNARRKKGLKLKEAAGCLGGDCASCAEGVCPVPEKKEAALAASAEKKEEQEADK